VGEVIGLDRPLGFMVADRLEEVLGRMEADLVPLLKGKKSLPRK